MNSQFNDRYLCDLTLPYGQDIRLPDGNRLKRESIANIPIAIPDSIRNNLESVSQLGLKDMYFGSAPGSHNRWEHSKGANTIGMVWLESLYSNDGIPKHLSAVPYPEKGEAQVLCGYALLLHDLGHLFFSHLLDEVMQGINWIPKQRGISNLEYTLLKERLEGEESLKREIQSSLIAMGASLDDIDPLHAVVDLTNGWTGLSWLQNVVNGPVDADKIDYIRRDQEFMRRVRRSVHTRLNFGEQRGGNPWLEEFLASQYVNHMGYLCLSGRSAVAAADLWRERLVLYDRFYLSPEIRVADRMAAELVQQFLIRLVMSAEFVASLRSDRRIAQSVGFYNPKPLADEIDEMNARGSVDLIAVKYTLVTKFLASLSRSFPMSSRLDWDCLDWIWSALEEGSKEKGYAYQREYFELLKAGWDALSALADGSKSLEENAEKCVVGVPLTFARSEMSTVASIARAFQHRYSSEVLVDVIVMPKVLSSPKVKGRQSKEERFCGVLVPVGAPSTWQRSSGKLEPLTEGKVSECEMNYGRIIVISPCVLSEARRAYLFDRLTAMLTATGVECRGGD